MMRELEQFCFVSAIGDAGQCANLVEAKLATGKRRTNRR